MQMQSIVSRNPGKNYQTNGAVDVTPDNEIKRKVEKANEAKEGWRRIGVKGRVALLKKVQDALKERADDIAKTITKEVGTPIAECMGEIAWDWTYFEWFLENAVNALAPEVTHEDDAVLYQQVYEPIGSAAVITPWNLPFDMFVWGVMPNLLVGNTVVYKAAEECALTSKLLEEIMGAVNLPDGVFSMVQGAGEQGELLTKQDVDIIWFTGSSEVGKKLYDLAGKKFIKGVMELGGSNPAIVFEDADLDKVVSTVVFKRYSFAGQTCDAVKRLIVHEDVYDKLLAFLTAKVAAIKIGDPEDGTTGIGPLVSKKQLDALLSQVATSVKAGAKVVIGGKQPEDLQGAYYLPTILANVTPDMPVWREEVFGPVLPIVTFTEEAEAVRMANDTEYGLGSQVYTADKARAARVAAEIKAGSVDINGTNRFRPFNSFGGYKGSGMGREHGIYGLRELCQVKVLSQTK